MTIELRPASCLPFLAMFLEIDVFIRIQYQGYILLFYNDSSGVVLMNIKPGTTVKQVH